MLVNLLVKQFLARLQGGVYVREQSTLAFYPTLDVRKANVVIKVAAYTVTLADLNTKNKPTIFNNTAASGDLPLTLPSAASAVSKVLRANCLAAQTISLTPISTDIINYNGNAVVAKYARIAGVIGNYIEVYSDGTQWIVTQANGVVTKQP